MMKTSTIQKRVTEIVELREKKMKLESDCERDYGFVTQSVESKVDRLEKRAQTKQDKLVSLLHDSGLCSEDGVTSDEADHPTLRGIDQLFEIGDGSWC